MLSQGQGGPVTPVVFATVNDEGKLDDDGKLDSELAAVLSAAGFTGNIEETFRRRREANLGRPINPKLANFGRLLWFDKLHSLHHDNTCGGCHSPTMGSAILNPWPSASKITIWLAHTAPDRETNAGPL